MFDPFFDNERRGWWQKGDAYIHRKILIDSLYGELNVKEFSNLVKIYIKETFKVDIKNVENISFFMTFSSHFFQIKLNLISFAKRDSLKIRGKQLPRDCSE